MFKQRLSFRIGNVVVRLARLAKVTSSACAKAITPLALVGCICPLSGGAAPLQISAFDCSGKLAWSNAPVPGICTIESAVTPGSPWSSGHSGDGLYFYSPAEWRISEGRSITMDYAGNILVCESDYGYVRRIRFQRME